MAHHDAPPQGLTARDLRFGINDHAERAWFGKDAVKSALVDGFGVMFPVGERFMNRALLHYAKTMENPHLLNEIKGFVMQEAFHTREHEGYNTALRGLGYDVSAMEKRLADYLNSFETPLDRLAATCALEQITGGLARMCLRREKLWDEASPAYRRLWRWHALEEIEHSSVALQVYRAVSPQGPRWKRYALRIKHLAIAGACVGAAAIHNAADILRGEDERLSLRQRLRLLWALVGAPGFACALIVPFLSYLRPGYQGTAAADECLVKVGRLLLHEDAGLA